MNTITFEQAWAYGGVLMWVLAALSVAAFAVMIYLLVAHSPFVCVPVALRRIHAANKVWCMGTPSLYTEMGCNAVTSDENENISIPHLVSLTKDYYMAIYEMTAQQMTRAVSSAVIHRR